MATRLVPPTAGTTYRKGFTKISPSTIRVTWSLNVHTVEAKLSYNEWTSAVLLGVALPNLAYSVRQFMQVKI
ncbi:hypothetical protein BC938DRAFT_471425 [Jimgerdemannia flammicorona]|uniref:Uncharacterized protein n=1 Tax=Jimgerdemannia flammicorona TaxID=994334 RepID=A0A433Q860_9FUNG|nr:hypothetical protein BC938DRAFT_471425 [Jimgerdemannia flammicorona]